MKTETQIQREICEYLSAKKYFFWRTNNIPVMGRALPKFTPRGLPDIMMVHSGKLITFEVKRQGSEIEREPNGRAVRTGMLTPQQADWGIALEDNGGKYFCVRSLDETIRCLSDVLGS